MAIKVGRWDCTQCGHLGNLGPNTRCEKCGAPRPKDVKFYLPQDAEIVVDIQKQKEAKSGADWVCSFCNAQNKSTHLICQSCGNDRDATDGDKSLEEKTYLYQQNQTDTKSSSKLWKYLKRAVIGLFAFFIVFAILTQIKTDVKVTVTACKWERTIEIEEYKKVVEEDWQLPEGSEKIDSFRAIHHYNKVADGTETQTRTVQKQTGTEKVKVGEKDLGNGYFEDIYEERPVYEDVEETYETTKYKQVPVYQTKYKYSIYKWIEIGKRINQGDEKPAYWPDDERLKDENKFRIKQRSGEYSVVVNFEGKEIPEKVNYDYWNKTKIGDVLDGEKSTIFGTYYGIKKERTK